MADYTDIDKLRELAEAATPGPWESYSYWNEYDIAVWAVHEIADDPAGEQHVATTDTDGIDCAREDAAFIAAASPDVVLALVAELVGLRTVVDQLRTENDDRRDALREVDAERDAALARAVRAEQALLGVRKTLDALCEPTRLTHPTRLRSALDAFLAAVPVVSAEEPTEQAEAQQ